MNASLLSSEGRVDLRDLRRHLDWLLDLLEPAAAPLLELQRVPGLTMRIHNVWWSAQGHGGPAFQKRTDAEPSVSGAPRISSNIKAPWAVEAWPTWPDSIISRRRRR